MQRSLVLLLLLACLGLGLAYLSGGAGSTESGAAPGQAEQATEQATEGIGSLPANAGVPENRALSAGNLEQERPLDSSSARRPAVLLDEEPVFLKVKTVALNLGWGPSMPRSFPEERTGPNVPFVIVRDTAGGQLEVLLRGKTDASGECTLELEPEGPLLEALRTSYLVRAHAGAGYQRRVETVAQSADNPLVYEVELYAEPGLTVRGEVLNASGQRALAKVEFHYRDSPDAVERDPEDEVDDPGFDQDAYSQRGGIFQLHLKRGGVGDLIADGGHEGVGSIRNIALALDTAPKHQMIQLAGVGELIGRVRNSSGEPVADLPLLVQLASLEDGSGNPRGNAKAHSLLIQEGIGRPRAELTTNKLGQFRGSALHEGAYFVRARLPGSTGVYPFLLTQGSVPANGSSLELRLSRPHLLMRLRDADGGEWSGGAIKSISDTRLASSANTTWSTHTQLIVVACERKDGQLTATDKFLRGREIGRGEFLFELLEGSDYLVGATGSGFDGQLQALFAPPGSDRQVLELIASPGVQLGRIRIKASIPGEQERRVRRTRFLQKSPPNPLGEGLASESVAQAALDFLMVNGGIDLRLVQQETGYPVLNVTLQVSQREQLIEAPVGSYRVVANLLGRDARLESGVTTVPLRVTPGEEIEVKLSIPPSGLLEISLSGAGSGSSTAVDSARLTLRDSLGVAIPLQRRTDRGQWWQSPWQLGNPTETWPLGETHLSGALPPGPYELTGNLEGGASVTTSVHLLPGEVTRVNLDF